MPGTNLWTLPLIASNFYYFNVTTLPSQTTGTNLEDLVTLYFDNQASALLTNAFLDVTINGMDFGIVPQTNNYDQLYPVLATSNAVVYSITVPHSIWGLSTNVILQVVGNTTNFSPVYTNIVQQLCNLLDACSLSGGEQESVYIATNSPSWLGAGPSTNAVPPVRMGIGPGAAPQSFNITWPTLTNATVGVQVTHQLNPPANWQPLNGSITNFGAGVSGVTVYNTNSPPTNAFFRLIEH